MSQDRQVLIERFARHFEALGHPRISGRLLAYALTSDEPRLSLTRIATDLQVSKASVSTNARLLIGHRLLALDPVPGSRETHYVVVPDGARQALGELAARALTMVELAEQGLELCAGTITPGAVALRSMRDSYLQVHDLVTQQQDLAAGQPRW